LSGFGSINREEDKKLNLILYTKKTAPSGAQLRLVFESLVSKDAMELFHSIEGLRNRLLRTNYNDGIVVLIADSREELSELLPILHLFRKVRIILVLPDRKPETIKIGYQLEPRFLSFIDQGLTEVKAVLKKMLSRASYWSKRPDSSRGAIVSL
jgi:hypothetical protein